MEHLEFTEKLNQLGCSFRSTNIENKVKTIEICNTLGKSDFVEMQNLKCRYVEKPIFSSPTPLQAVISKALDIDNWKHSWHNDITPENYEKFREIIQDKMIKRAEEMDFLLSVYFQLQHEISNQSEG
jgi:hypothetical protein